MYFPPILFNLILEKIVREINLCESVELDQSKINNPAYADNIAKTNFLSFWKEQRDNDTNGKITYKDC